MYAPIAHWVWGGGFLAQMGFADFAGGIVVHTSASFAALASILIIGKRKFDGEKAAPHNVTYIPSGRLCCGLAGSASMAAARWEPMAWLPWLSSTPISPPRSPWSPG